MSNTSYEQTHNKILESGKKLFLRDGYERSNLREICKGAGVTTGAFYRHFKDKEDLFSALVGPLANDISSFYSKFEEKAFEKINTNKLDELAQIKIAGTLETVRFLYKYKEEYILLTSCSYGTKYSDFLEKFVEKEDINRLKIQSMVSKAKSMNEKISKDTLHILNHIFMNALSEVVIHAKSIEEAERNAAVIVEFFCQGWSKLRGF